jgi:hypothetical protein
MKEAGVGNVISEGGTGRMWRSRAIGQIPQTSSARERISIITAKPNRKLRMQKLYTDGQFCGYQNGRMDNMRLFEGVNV